MNTFFLSLTLILAGGVLPLLCYRHFTAMKVAGTAAIALGSLLGVVAAAAALFGPAPLGASWIFQHRFALAFQMDGLSAYFLLVVCSVSLMAALYSYHYLAEPRQTLRAAVHYLFFSLLVLSMALVVVAHNMVTFMLMWEIMSLSSFFLVIYHYEAALNRQAGYLYFIFSQAGAMFILAAFGVIYAETGNLDLAVSATTSPTIKTVVFILALIGFGSKAGVFPLHVWLPHAHPAAPSHISALMSGVMIKIGIYGILRMYALLDLPSLLLGQAVLLAGIVSGILGVVYALGQHDLKRLLAYHSVENIGIILIGLGLGMIGVAVKRPEMALLGFAGGLLHVYNHALFKSLLFLGAGMVLKQTGTRAIDALGGLAKHMKLTGIAFLIGSLAISGLPPFNGFVSEFLIYLGGFRGVGLDRGPFVMSLLAIVSLAVIGGLALACFTKVVGVVFLGEPRSRAAQAAGEKGGTMLLPMLILAAACLFIGVFPNLFVVLAIKGMAGLGLGYGRLPLLPVIQLTGKITWVAALCFALLALVLAVRTLLYRKKIVTRAGTWGCGFTQPNVRMQYTGSSYAASILAFFKPVAPLSETHPPVRGRFPAPTHYHSTVGDVAELCLTGLTARPVMYLFDKLRWIQHGDIHLYIGYIFLAIVVLLFFV